jgi:hypothetical protein
MLVQTLQSIFKYSHLFPRFCQLVVVTQMLITPSYNFSQLLLSSSSPSKASRIVNVLNRQPTWYTWQWKGTQRIGCEMRIWGNLIYLSIRLSQWIDAIPWKRYILGFFHWAANQSWLRCNVHVAVGEQQQDIRQPVFSHLPGFAWTCPHTHLNLFIWLISWLKIAYGNNIKATTEFHQSCAIVQSRLIATETRVTKKWSSHII